MSSTVAVQVLYDPGFVRSRICAGSRLCGVTSVELQGKNSNHTLGFNHRLIHATRVSIHVVETCLYERVTAQKVNVERLGVRRFHGMEPSTIL